MSFSAKNTDDEDVMSFEENTHLRLVDTVGIGRPKGASQTTNIDKNVFAGFIFMNFPKKTTNQ